MEGCNGEFTRAIEQCLAVDDTRTVRRSISSPDSGQSSASAGGVGGIGAIQARHLETTKNNIENIKNEIEAAKSLSTATTTSQASTVPTSPQEFFRNLTSPQVGRPLLSTFPHYMVRKINLLSEINFAF